MLKIAMIIPVLISGCQLLTVQVVQNEGGKNETETNQESRVDVPVNSGDNKKN